MASDNYDFDAQDQAEVFDEDNLDGEPGGVARNEFKTFEEIPDVLDVTQALGDSRDDAAVDEADFDEAALDDEDLEDEDEVVQTDTYEEGDEDDVTDRDARDGVADGAGGEVDLVFSPDVDGRRGAQSSAAHFESRGELDTDDLTELGYAGPKEPK